MRHSMHFFVFALTILLFFTSAEAAVVTKEIDYKDGKVELRGTLAYDDAVSSPRPGVVLFPEWWGYNDYIKRRAREMAEQGYIAFAADMYGKDKVTTDPAKAKSWSGELYSNRQAMRDRARAALKILKSQPNVDTSHIAAIGFCMGGTVALELARAGEDLNGVAAFHAGLQFPDKIEKGQVKAKILVMNGGADPNVPFSERDSFIEEIQNAGADLQFIQYGGAVHAFTNPDADKFGIKGIAYDPVAERRSFEELRTFFAEIFGK